jgi:iron complex outermembrane receptor protein
MSFPFRISSNFIIAAGIAAIGLVGTSAYAQEAGATASSVLEEIVVTARRREESLQDTPISITAFTGASLNQRQINRLSGIGSFTPNLMFDTGATFSGANSSASVFIRGIGQVDFTLTTEPGVGIYLDGVYMSQTIGSVLDLVDIERIEVLRGPQGTLFGRNTIGGAISVTSTRPANELQADVKVTGGEDSRFDVRAGVNFPIADNLAVRLSAATFNRDGYVAAPNTPSGEELGDINQDVARLALGWEPDEKFRLDFNVDWSRQRENGVPNVLVGVFDGATFAIPVPPIGTVPTDALAPLSFVDLHNLVATAPFGEQGCLPPFAMPPPFCSPTVVPNPRFLQSDICGGTGLNPPGICSPGRSDIINVQNDPWVNSSTLNLTSQSDVWGANLTLAYDFNRATIRSITSYREMEAFTAIDIDAVEVLIGDLVDDFETEQFTQEFQLSGVAINDRLNWLVGLYYFTEEGTNLDDVEFTPARFLSGAQVDNESTAAFGQVTFDFTDKLSLTAGVRYTDETKKFIVPDTCFAPPKGPATSVFDPTTGMDVTITCARLQSVIDPKFLNGTDSTDPSSGFLPWINLIVGGDPNRDCCLPISNAAGIPVGGFIPGLDVSPTTGLPQAPANGNGFPLVPGGTAERSFEDWTPHISLAYKWTEDLLTYLSYSEGFKSGGFVQRVFPPKTEVPSFEPESAKVYELGFKWLGADERLRLNGAVFFTDYEDLQIEVNDGIAPVTRNAAEAEITGFELELTAVPGANWQIQAGVGYLDAAICARSLWHPNWSMRRSGRAMWASSTPLLLVAVGN